MAMTMTDTASIKPANWGKLKDQVVSWIDGENHCVTAQRISQSLDISRKLGSQLLEEILIENHKHQITICQKSQDENTTVFRLRTTTAAKTIDSSTSVFALSSLDTDESVEAAHERDMVQWRESVDEKRFQQATVSAIAPSEKLKDAENAIAVSRTRGIGGEDSSLSSSSTPLVRPGKPNAKAKAMTAASFFGGHKAQNKANKVVQKKTVQKSTEKKKEISKPVKKVQANPSKIGNADDFQADEEESDDEEVVRVVPKRQPVRLQKVAPAPKEVEIKSSPVRGAMDAFCNDEEKPNNQRRRKRRKKLVEKTSMVGGYLRTETVTLWEDIPTDEENDEIEKKKIARSKPTGAVSKSKNSQNMKQKSLMGFFAKK